MSEPITAPLFEHIDLNQIDPNIKPIDAGFYNLRVQKIELREFKYKVDVPNMGVTAGDPGQFLNFTLVVSDHPTASGRRLWPSMFFGNKELRHLRRLQDNTGVYQDPGTPLTDWLTLMNTTQPTFSTFVSVEDDVDKKGIPNPRTVQADGKPIKVNRVDFGQLRPAA